MVTDNGAFVGRAQSLGAQPRAPEFELSGRAMLPTGEEFACTARSITVRTAEIFAKVVVAPQQIVVCYLDDLGIIAGRVTTAQPGRFTLTLSFKDERRERVATQLEWHVQRAARTAELRRAPRIVPAHTAVEVRLGDRIVLTGEILNISLSGAAIRLNGDAIPFVGARVRVGARFAKVVRPIEAGIAVAFDEPFTPHNFDACVRP